MDRPELLSPVGGKAKQWTDLNSYHLWEARRTLLQP